MCPPVRLVFLLGEDTEGPAALFADLEYGARQHAFRARLADSGVTTATVTSPAELETAVLQALTALPRPDQQPAGTAAAHGPALVGRRVWTIPARVRGFTGRAELLAELEAALRSGGPTVVQAVTGMGGIGKTSAAIEYAHRHRAEFDIAWWVPAENPALIPERLAELALALTTAASPAGIGYQVPAGGAAVGAVIKCSRQVGLSRPSRGRRPQPQVHFPARGRMSRNGFVIVGAVRAARRRLVVGTSSGSDGWGFCVVAAPRGGVSSAHIAVRGWWRGGSELRRCCSWSWRNVRSV
jgi:hypothetical protein